MSINVLLHVNALHTTDEARASFEQLLKENLWIRMHSLYPNWCCKYRDDVADVSGEVMAEIKEMAARAGVGTLHAVAQCGNSHAFWFEFNAPTRSETRSRL